MPDMADACVYSPVQVQVQVQVLDTIDLHGHMAKIGEPVNLQSCRVRLFAGTVYRERENSQSDVDTAPRRRQIVSIWLGISFLRYRDRDPTAPPLKPSSCK